MCEAGCLLWCISPVKIMLDSLKIMVCNKMVFTSIMALTTLPLSSLIISLSISTHPLRSQIHHLEALAHHAPTRFEARHVWKESRHDALSLLRTKALFSLPSYLLSLAAAVSAVHSTVTAYHGKIPTLHSAASAVKHNWKRPCVTTIFVYAILLAYAPLPRAFGALTASSPGWRLVVVAVGCGVEVYLMAVVSMALVVSIAEERFGWEAIKVGSGLIAGRRLCGWVLSGLFVLVSGLIRWKLELLMDGQNSSFMAIGVEDKAILICSYGFAVVCSYVIISVFYCDCRRRLPIREPEPDDQQQQEAVSV